MVKCYIGERGEISILQTEDEWHELYMHRIFKHWH